MFKMFRMTLFQRIILLIGIILFLTSCATTKRDWQKATQINSIEAYREFLQNHPQSEFSNKAKANIEELEWMKVVRRDATGAYQEFLSRYPNSKYMQEAQKRIETLVWLGVTKENTKHSYIKYLSLYPAGAFVSLAKEEVDKIDKLEMLLQMLKKAKVIRIVIDQSYENAPVAPHQPFYERIRQMLEGVGFEVEGGKETGLVPILNIRAKGTAWGDHFVPGPGGGKVYTGATIKCEISLKMLQRILYSKNIEGSWNLLRRGWFRVIDIQHRDPNNAPFDVAFQNGLALGLFEAISEISIFFGIDPLSFAIANFKNEMEGSAEALRKIGEPAVTPLVVFLKDENRQVRAGAVKALGKIGSAAVEPLIASLKDNDRNVRGAAVSALWHMKDNRAVKPLITKLEDEDGNIRYWAACALKEITGQDFQYRDDDGRQRTPIRCE